MGMARLIDADAFLESIEGTDWYSFDCLNGFLLGASSEEYAWYKATDMYHAIETAPTVDAVPVVRCHNCKKSDQNEKDIRLGRVWCHKMCVYMKQDGFCSEGVKKGD